jgi:hypothetical protein
MQGLVPLSVSVCAQGQGQSMPPFRNLRLRGFKDCHPCPTHRVHSKLEPLGVQQVRHSLEALGELGVRHKVAVRTPGGLACVGVGRWVKQKKKGGET